MDFSQITKYPKIDVEKSKLKWSPFSKNKVPLLSWIKVTHPVCWGELDNGVKLIAVKVVVDFMNIFFTIYQSEPDSDIWIFKSNNLFSLFQNDKPLNQTQLEFIFQVITQKQSTLTDKLDHILNKKLNYRRIELWSNERITAANRIKQQWFLCTTQPEYSLYKQRQLDKLLKEADKFNTTCF